MRILTALHMRHLQNGSAPMRNSWADLYLIMLYFWKRVTDDLGRPSVSWGIDQNNILTKNN